MKTRFIASFLVAALAQLPATNSFAQDRAATAAPAAVSVTTIKRTTIRIGNLSLPLTEGTKLEVLGRDRESLLVKFRSSQGKVPARDTDFNPASAAVPEIAPEPAVAKSTDLTISAAPVRSAQTHETVANSNRAATTGKAPQKDSKPARGAMPSAPPPPVNN